MSRTYPMAGTPRLVPAAAAMLLAAASHGAPLAADGEATLGTVGTARPTHET